MFSVYSLPLLLFTGCCYPESDRYQHSYRSKAYEKEGLKAMHTNGILYLLTKFILRNPAGIDSATEQRGIWSVLRFG